MDKVEQEFLHCQLFFTQMRTVAVGYTTCVLLEYFVEICTAICICLIKSLMILSSLNMQSRKILRLLQRIASI